MVKRVKENDDFKVDINSNPTLSKSKLPIDITNGIKPIQEYINIPCDSLIEYQDKQDSDFRPYSKEKFDALVESIKENGVLEAITVRPLPSGKFEILAGEHRWKASVAAGKPTIRARVLQNPSETLASNYYTITNLIRRDTSVCDKVNGWWHWVQKNDFVDKKGLLDELNDSKIVSEQLQIRQVLKLAKLHDLVKDLFDRLDGGNYPLSIKAGYQLSFLPKEQQQMVADLNVIIQERTAIRIRNLSEQGKWSKEALEEVALAPKNKVRAPSFSKKIKTIAKEKLRPEAFLRADEIFEKALDLYLKQYPEDMKPLKEKEQEESV